MRLLIVALLILVSFAAGAAEATTGRVIKVLPLWLDGQGRDATSPSLFDRDAYQAYLRGHTNEIAAVRFDVEWDAAQVPGETLKLRLELRGIDDNGVPKLKTVESAVRPGHFRRWTPLTLGGEDFKQFGSIVAWRVTLRSAERPLGEKKSFLW